MHVGGVRFSIAAHAAWAPGLDTPAAWSEWADAPFRIAGGADAPVRGMPAMLRRRAGSLGKMALEVAYQCLGGRTGIPTVFVSRHGEVARAVDLLGDLAKDTPLSPTAFGLAVHNASAGLFSIARADRANHVALAAGPDGVEHAVIEACGQLADGAGAVLLVAYDCPLPDLLAQFQDCDEQPYAFAWLLVPAADAPFSLGWSACADDCVLAADAMPAGLEVLRFQLSGQDVLERRSGPRRWLWTRHA